MKRRLIAAIVAAQITLAPGAPAIAGEPGISGDDDRAKVGLRLAKKLCARCHAVGDETVSPHNDAPPFRTFASKWPLENLEESLAEGIVTGHPDMPAFVFEPEDIDALIEHLHSLALKDPARQ